jgi:hypothetical protein
MKNPVKESNPKPGDKSKTPVFPQTLHRLRTNPEAVAGGGPAKPKPVKRDNIFSKSRDNREDRGERQIKTSHNPETFSRSK